MKPLALALIISVLFWVAFLWLLHHLAGRASDVHYDNSHHESADFEINSGVFFSGVDEVSVCSDFPKGVLLQ